MFGIDRETLRLLRSKYSEGSHVRLTKMEDILAPPIGTCGTVKCVDDLGCTYCLGHGLKSWSNLW